MKFPILILGATGRVGRGLVAAAVEAGRPVLAAARDPARLRQLQVLHPDADIALLPGSVASDAQGARLAKAVRKRGEALGGVIVAVRGDSGRGRLLEQPALSLRRTFDGDLLPHLVAARHLLPLLAESMRVARNRGGYVLIGGPGGEQPWAGYGHRSVSTAALRMLARVLHDEAQTHAVRVQLLLVDRPIRSDASGACACPQWPSAIAVGQRALALIDPDDVREPARAIVRHTAAGTSLPLPEHHADAQRCLSDARALLHAMQFTTYPEIPRK